MRKAFSLIELLVVIGIIGLLLAIVLPAVERVRHRGYFVACAANLHAIGQAMALYAGENHGQWPRTRYVPDQPPTAGTGAASADSFAGPQPNDVTAAFFLLARQQRLPLATFVCPYDDVFAYQPDPADPRRRANFTDVQKHLGYSFADMYPSTAVRRAGFDWSAAARPGFPVAADKNPGVDTHKSNVNAPDLATRPQQGESLNHERDGQNVLYADGHVALERTPLCGIGGDNLYTDATGGLTAGPQSPADAVLLPTDDPE